MKTKLKNSSFVYENYEITILKGFQNSKKISIAR